MPEVQSRSYANPRRLPRRNHYQEGPGFLFVATQGGRPPDDDGLRNLAGVVRRRRAALRRWADGDPLATICAEFRCSRASLFRWRTRFERDGLAGLLDRPRVGRRSDLPTTVERLILTVRLLTYWNSGRIAAEFRRRAVWPLTHGQVDRVLARHGTHRPSYVRTPGPRYERAAANELWHIDLKDPFYFVGATGLARTCHFVALVDDHSRFLLTDPGRPDQAGRSDPRPARGGDRAVRGAARAHDRQRDAVRRDHPHDAQPVPAQPRRARDPPHPDPDRHALDERQDRGVLAHAPGGGPRSPAARRSRRGRGGRHRLRRLLQLPPAPRRARLADTGRTVRRHALHRPRLRQRPVPRRCGRSTRRDPGGLNQSHLHRGTSLRGTHQRPGSCH